MEIATSKKYQAVLDSQYELSGTSPLTLEDYQTLPKRGITGLYKDFVGLMDFYDLEKVFWFSILILVNNVTLFVLAFTSKGEALFWISAFLVFLTAIPRLLFKPESNLIFLDSLSEWKRTEEVFVEAASKLAPEERVTAFLNEIKSQGREATRADLVWLEFVQKKSNSVNRAE